MNNGALWCNGQCIWYNGGCHNHNLWTNLMDSIYASFYIWLRTLPITLFLGIVMLAYATIYKSKIVDHLEHLPPKGDDSYWRERHYGLFSCFSRPDLCMWSTFCTPVVAAKNYDVGNVMGYYASCFCLFLGMFTCFWPFYCILALVRTSWSQKLSRNLRLRPDFCLDFWTTLFCFPCDVARESMEVDEAIGVELKCPFKVYR